MTEDCKKFCCKKAGIQYHHYNSNYRDDISKIDKIINYGILSKAKDAINREGKWFIQDKINGIGYRVFRNGISDRDFYFSDYNNSEIEALEKALTYIFDYLTGYYR